MYTIGKGHKNRIWNRQTILNNSAVLSVVKRSCLEFIAMGNELCLSSAVLVFRVLYILWEGRGVNGLFPEWVESVAVRLPFFCIWSAYTESRFWRGWPTISCSVFTTRAKSFLSCFCAAAMSDCHTETENAFCSGTVAVCQQLRERPGLLEIPQEKIAFCSVFFTRWDVFKAQVRSAMLWISRNGDHGDGMMVFRTRLLGSDAGPPLFSGSGHYLI